MFACFLETNKAVNEFKFLMLARVVFTFYDTRDFFEQSAFNNSEALFDLTICIRVKQFEFLWLNSIVQGSAQRIYKEITRNYNNAV
jgi:hypothetical protein